MSRKQIDPSVVAILIAAMRSPVSRIMNMYQGAKYMGHGRRKKIKGWQKNARR